LNDLVNINVAFFFLDKDKKNRELFVGLEVLDYLPIKQEGSRQPRANCFFVDWCMNLSRIRAARIKQNRLLCLIYEKIIYSICFVLCILCYYGTIAIHLQKYKKNLFYQ